MNALPVLIAYGAFLLWLFLEKILLNRALERIPYRISVTGIRGKSSLVRALTSILHNHGDRVLGKITGSETTCFLPDGSQSTLHRRGMPTILEQVRVIRMASRLNLRYLISEVMSIQRETHFVESQRILRPHLVVITNIEEDHLDAMGSTREEIADTLALDLPTNAVVFLPARYFASPLHQALSRSGAELIPVAGRDGSSSHPFLFRETVDLATAVARYLAIDSGTIARGIAATPEDAGTPRIWRIPGNQGGAPLLLVNGFAGNDPTSTMAMVGDISKRLGISSTSTMTALVNLRWDRGDRTHQWIRFFTREGRNSFERILVMGGHAKLFTRRVKGSQGISARTPAEVILELGTLLEPGSVIFGCGNIGGLARRVLQQAREVGEYHEF